MAEIMIVVEASLGDSLAKLGLAKSAVDDLGDSGESTAQRLSDFNSSMDDATIASHRAGSAIHDTDKLIRDAENAITGTESALTGGGGGGGGLNGAFMSLGDAGLNAQKGFGLVMQLLVGSPIVIVAATAAIIGLADAFGTLVAITADLVAPLGLVGGLLGSLGLGFIFAAKRAADGGGKLSEFSNKLDTLHSMFSKTTDILAHAFLPYLDRLAGAAKKALLFIDKLAHEPLDKAMRDMATKGVQMLTQFVEQVAHVVAHPIRLAFKIAFGDGKGGNEFASAVAGWWHQLTDFLFGYTQTHRMNLPLEKQFAPIRQSHVNGIFQPLIDWFNRHHFTKQGEEIGHSILDGFTSSGAAHRMGQFIVSALKDAFIIVVGDAIHQLERLSAWFIGATNRWHDEINHAIESAGREALNYLEGLFSHALTIVVDVVPHFLGALGSLLGTTPTGPSTPNNPTGNRGKPNIANVSNLAGGTHFHFHAGPGMSGIAERAAFSRFSRQVGQELARQQGLLAGGH